MAWVTSARRERLPANWHALRRLVLNRDEHRCTWAYPNGGRCSAKANQVDHIDRHGGDGLENLRALCEKHHYRKSAYEGVEAKKENIARAKAVVRRVEVDPAVRAVPVAPSGRRGY